MMMRRKEILAVVATVATLVGMPALIFGFSNHRPAASGGRVIVLTGVKRAGVWTDEEVTAANFGVKEFRAATITMRQDEKLTLRLSSADVEHGFYVPELKIGPVIVKPGKVVEVVIDGAPAGEYTYYCTRVCGECHHFMRGTIVVLDKEGKRVPSRHREPLGCEVRHHHDPLLPIKLARGERVFHQRGCVSCHGWLARGGVDNPNYIKGTVPRLDILAKRFLLTEPEEARTAVALLLSDVDVVERNLPGKLSMPAVFFAQYKSAHDLIRAGNPAGKKNPDGIDPPLHMPRWGDVLTEREIRDVLAYVISLYDFKASDDQAGDDDDDDDEASSGDDDDDDDEAGGDDDDDDDASSGDDDDDDDDEASSGDDDDDGDGDDDDDDGGGDEDGRKDAGASNTPAANEPAGPRKASADDVPARREPTGAEHAPTVPQGGATTAVRRPGSPAASMPDDRLAEAAAARLAPPPGEQAALGRVPPGARGCGCRLSPVTGLPDWLGLLGCGLVAGCLWRRRSLS